MSAKKDKLKDGLRESEVALIKAMLQRNNGKYMQHIHAHFTWPDRHFNQRAISQIHSDKHGDGVILPKISGVQK